MEKEKVKEISQELFEAMDFGSNTIVDCEKWHIEIFRNGAEATLTVLLDYNNHPIDEPSATCHVTIAFYDNTLIPETCVCENEYGEVLAEINPKEYFTKKEAEKLAKELENTTTSTTKKIKI